MHEFNPYAPSSRAPIPIEQRINPSECWKDGSLLVVSSDSVLPDRCVVCNASADGYRLGRNVSWHTSDWLWLLVLNPLLYLVARMRAPTHQG